MHFLNEILSNKKLIHAGAEGGGESVRPLGYVSCCVLKSYTRHAPATPLTSKQDAYSASVPRPFTLDGVLLYLCYLRMNSKYDEKVTLSGF